MIVLGFLAVLALCSDAGHNAVESPYMKAFLGPRSGKTIKEIMEPHKHSRHIIDRRGSSNMTMSVYPNVLSDYEDAVVTYNNVPNPTPNDFITVSCGPTNGVSDYLDMMPCNAVPSNTPGGITNLTFAVGPYGSNPTCPEGFVWLPTNLKQGTQGDTIYACYTKNTTYGQPYSTITSIAGSSPSIECPPGFLKIDQDMNAGAGGAFIYICYSYENYEAGVNDVEGIYVYATPNYIEFPCVTGYTWVGYDLNHEAGGDYIYMCFKEGNATVPQQNSVRFEQLVYMRCNYTFTYVTIENGEYVALDDIVVPNSEGLGWPTQGHIALTENEDEMMVIYVTGTQNTPYVKYGLNSDNMNIIVNGTTITYAATQLCDSPANITSQTQFRDPGFMHWVLLTGLPYNTVYYYQFGNDKDGWSQVYSFTSRVDPATRNISFIAYADMGVWAPPSSMSMSTASLVSQDVMSGFHDFLIHFGDVSYACGTAYQWEQFFHLVQPYATRIPYMVSIGNHEYDHENGGQNDPSFAPGNGWHPSWGNMGSDSGGECAVPMVHRFTSPSNGNGIFWYSFNYGPVHVISISSEHDWTPGAEQYLWMEQDLQSVNRTATPWVILTSHRMMYTTQLLENGDYIVSVHMREAFEDLLYQYQVNLMLVGHQHSYERTCMVYRNECRSDGTGTVHIVVGTAGAGLEAGGFSPALGNFSLVQLDDWGYLRLYATETTLTTQLIRNDEESIYDTVTLYPWPSSQGGDDK